MTYSLFYVDGVTSTEQNSGIDRLSRLEFQSMGETIDAGCKRIKIGCVVWRIESRRGFVMERNDVECECVRRSHLKIQKTSHSIPENPMSSGLTTAHTSEAAGAFLCYRSE
jgi:hypothetical protein